MNLTLTSLILWSSKICASQIYLLSFTLKLGGNYPRLSSVTRKKWIFFAFYFFLHLLQPNPEPISFLHLMCYLHLLLPPSPFDGGHWWWANRRNGEWRMEVVSDDRLNPDLLRGRGKSIGGDLDIDDEGSEQNFKPLQSLHHDSIGYQSIRAYTDWPCQEGLSLQAQLRTHTRTEKMQCELRMND
jgi:hypothetical protein